MLNENQRARFFVLLLFYYSINDKETVIINSPGFKGP
jgi:hypothetical protein